MTTLALLIRDFFPDPDACCFALELRQEEWVRYFISLVIAVASEKVINNDARECANTRRDIMLTLRGFDNSQPNRTMKPEPDPKLIEFAEMLPIWPTVPYGGARSLHRVRIHFLAQYNVMLHMQHVHPRISPNLNRTKGLTADWEAFEKEITFGQRFKSKMKYNTIPAANAPGLHCDPAFIDTLFMIDVDDLKFSTLKKEARKNDRDFCWTPGSCQTETGAHTRHVPVPLGSRCQ